MFLKFLGIIDNLSLSLWFLYVLSIDIDISRDSKQNINQDIIYQGSVFLGKWQIKLTRIMQTYKNFDMDAPLLHIF